jgi:hypothetical protein
MTSFRAGEQYASLAAGHSNVVRLSDHRPPVAVVDAPAPDLSPRLEKLAAARQVVEQEAAYIAAAVEPGSLAADLIGIVGNSAGEIRRQLRPLREALRDGGDAA